MNLSEFKLGLGDRHFQNVCHLFPLILMVVLLATCTTGKVKPKVFVFTDINLVGGDPDDRQSLIHLLWYANELDIVGIVPDRWNGRGYEACLEGIEAYRQDFETYSFAQKGYPSSKVVKSWLSKNEETAIKSLLEACQQDNEPVYVLVWGAMRTLRNALQQHPDIASNIRVLSIGTGIKYGPKDEVPGNDCEAINWNGPGRNDIYNDPRFHQMWWLESNWTYNGMFVGEGPRDMFQKLAEYGAMGRNIKSVTKGHDWAQYFRVGDTPSVLYLIDQEHDINYPEMSSWAGLFKKPFPKLRPNYYTDDSGSIEWDYHDPCNTWENLEEMYAHNKNTLVAEREEMYKALLQKLDKIYGKKWP